MKRASRKTVLSLLSVYTRIVLLGVAPLLASCSPTEETQPNSDAPLGTEQALGTKAVPPSEAPRSDARPPTSAKREEANTPATSAHAKTMSAAMGGSARPPARAAGEHTITLLYTVNNLGYLSTCG